MKKYLPYVKKHLNCFILAPIFMIIEACGEFILPFLNANIIDKGAANSDVNYIIKCGIFMLIIAGIMLVAGVLGANFAIRGSAYLAAGIRKDTFDKIQTFSFTNIDKFSTGSLITRITNDITQIQTFSQNLLRGFFRSPVMLIGALVMSFIMNPKLSAVIFIIVPFLALATYLIIHTASPRYTVMQEKLDALNTNIGETITNERVIKSFVREDYETKKFSNTNKQLMKKSVSAFKMMILMMPVSTLSINVATLLVVWFSGKQIMVGNMEVGTLTAFITYLSQALTALNFLANIFLQGTRAAASNKRITEVLNTLPDIRDADNPITEDIKSGSVEFKNVNYRYFKSNHEHILDGIDLKIESGEFVGLIGSTGSGKSSLVSLISRLYDPDDGEVLLDGKNIKNLPLAKVRDAVSVVLQKNTLFSGTIIENLRWGDENATDEEIIKAAKLAQAHEFICSLSDGYNTELGQGGVNLSGGQKQRLCIARALLKKPKIIILDDSTSAVDTATDAKIRNSFKNELNGITKIIIAQRISSVMDADKIVVMDAGKIEAVGKHDELIRTSKTYKEIYYSQKDENEEALV